MADLMERVLLRMQAQYDTIGDQAMVLEAVAELLGIEPSDENGEGLVQVLARGMTRAPFYAMAMNGDAAAGSFAAGFLAGVEFAVATRLEIEADPR